MSTPRCLAVCASVVAGLTAALDAQNNESRGILAGAATTLLVDGGLGGSDDAETLVHPNGFTQSAPLTYQGPPGNFAAPSLKQVFAQHGNPVGIDVDAFSTGRDDLQIDEFGVLNVEPSSWGIWSFSLREGAIGVPGSRIAEQAAQGDVGATLFTYVLPGSNLPQQVVDRTERSHSRRELGLAGSSELDGVDFPLILGRDQALALAGGEVATEPGFGALIDSPETIYFSVSSATKNIVPASWWLDENGNPTPKSGGTIFCTRRVPFGALHVWTQPSVFRTYAELGLDQNEDVDALAVDDDRVLYSCVGNARDQFLFAYFGTDDGGAPPATPVTTTNNENVSDKVGKASIDDVDAVCTLDPTLGTAGGPMFGSDDFGSSCGFPQPGLLGVPRISGSAYRRYQGGTVHVDTFLVGWPPIAGPAPGFAAAFLTIGPTLTLIPIGGIHLRNPANTLAGDPQTETFVVPAAIALTNFDLTCRWVALDAATAELAEAWPARLFL